MTKALSPSSITRALRTSFIGRQVLYYPSLLSTMDAARQTAQAGAADGTIIIAGEQTAGRGRLKREWISPLGNIALSIILFPRITDLPYLIMIASLAVTYSIEKATRLKTQIKWPNDILVGGKKAGGILIENEVKGDKVAFSIVGIGINVDLNVNAYPGIRTTATSLRGKDLRVKIIRALLKEFERLYITLPKDSGAIFIAWRDRLETLRRKVRAASDTQTIEGIAEAVDESGALYIRTSGGTLEKVVAGDVTLRGE